MPAAGPGLPLLPHTGTAPIHSPADEAAIKALIKPYPAEAMAAHPVRHLLGRSGVGNAPGASDPYEYPELVLADPLG